MLALMVRWLCGLGDGNVEGTGEVVVVTNDGGGVMVVVVLMVVV